MIILALALTFLVSCATHNQSHQPELHYYADLFEAYYGVDTKYVDMVVAPTDWPSYATCTSWSNGDRRIKVDLVRFYDLSEEIRLAVIFHELGHCVLERDHTNTLMSNGCPTSMMHQYAMSRKCFENHRDYYLDELIKNRQDLVYIGGK